VSVWPELQGIPITPIALRFPAEKVLC